MRKIFILLVSLILYSSSLYGAEERREFKAQTIPDAAQKAQQGQQQQRPIVMPQPGSMISPTISPNITAPRIPQEVISQPQRSLAPLTPPGPSMQSIPSMPKYAAPPTSGEAPGTPVFGNSSGKVTKIGFDKDGVRFIEVDDTMFNRELDIKIKNLSETPVVKGASLYNFDEIKIGDTVDIMFYTQNEEETAVFIKVLTEEEMGETEQEPSSNLKISPEGSEDLKDLPAPPENDIYPQEE